MDCVKIGIIGCGNISPVYFRNAAKFDILEISGCADINPEAAKTRSEEFGVPAMTVSQLLAHPDIELVVNLTTPQAHSQIALTALAAGRGTYCEKPLAVSRNDGKKVIETAKSANLLVGSAPDTFLGAGIQTCRKLIDDGWIGKPVAGTAFMLCHGHESWHPDPGFYYLAGGGPMFDMGPYYLTALINLLGPVKRVSASTAKISEERIATSEARMGEKLPVEVTTHLAGTLDFASGAIITMVMSFEVWHHTHHHIEIYGTEGSLLVPDPNGFGGPVKVKRKNDREWYEFPLSHGYGDNMRIIGVVDLAYASKNAREPRCSGELAYHVLDVMCSFDESSQSNQHIEIHSTCKRPPPLPIGLVDGKLDE